MEENIVKEATGVVVDKIIAYLLKISFLQIIVNEKNKIINKG